MAFCLFLECFILLEATLYSNGVPVDDNNLHMIQNYLQYICKVFLNILRCDSTDQLLSWWIVSAELFGWQSVFYTFDAAN